MLADSKFHFREDVRQPAEASPLSDNRTWLQRSAIFQSGGLRHAQSFQIFAAFFLATLALQIWMGAFGVEHGFYSDDSAHFLNGLVIREYLYHALGTDPIRFAEQYYITYPKIAPLMWPPLFHVTLGLWLLPGWPAAPAALCLVALTTAWAAWRLHYIVRELAGAPAALVAAALFLTTPVVIQMSSVVMLDMAIAALSLEGSVWLARFVRSGASRDAVLYGVFTALACLTKGNGVAMVLLPGIAVLITGRLDLLRRAGLYKAAAIVLLFAVPLLAVSARFDAAIGDFAMFTSADVLYRVSFYFENLRRNLGLFMMALAAVGAVTTIARAARRRDPGVAPFAVALLALAAGALIFHVLSPHRAAVGRYLTMAVAPGIGLAVVGADALTRMMRAESRRRMAFAAVLVVMAGVALVVRPWPASRLPLGYRGIVNELAASDQLAGRRLLVVSDEVGEGAAVSEAAVLNLQPPPTIVRGSKLIGNDRWSGDRFQANYTSSAALLQDLEDLHIDYVLLDRSPGAERLPYFNLARVTASDPLRVERMEAAGIPVAGSRGRLELYRVKNKSPGPPKALQISLAYTLGRTLRR